MQIQEKQVKKTVTDLKVQLQQKQVEVSDEKMVKYWAKYDEKLSSRWHFFYKVYAYLYTLKILNFKQNFEWLHLNPCPLH